MRCRRKQATSLRHGRLAVPAPRRWCPYEEGLKSGGLGDKRGRFPFEQVSLGASLTRARLEQPLGGFNRGFSPSGQRVGRGRQWLWVPMSCSVAPSQLPLVPSRQGAARCQLRCPHRDRERWQHPQPRTQSCAWLNEAAQGGFVN